MLYLIWSLATIHKEDKSEEISSCAHGSGGLKLSDDEQETGMEINAVLGSMTNTISDILEPHEYAV